MFFVVVAIVDHFGYTDKMGDMVGLFLTRQTRKKRSHARMVSWWVSMVYFGYTDGGQGGTVPYQADQEEGIAY